jgi:nucleoside-diphosphate-sugar epimerase
MRVLVTGASGFVGPALVAALAKAGHRVRAAARRPPALPTDVETVQLGDLASDVDWPALAQGCDAIVHLAGIAHVGLAIPGALYDRVNHQATRALVRAAQSAKVRRFIFISSIRAQSGPSADHILTERDPPQPTEPYGASKLAAEQVVAASPLPYVIMRPVLVYGPQARGNFATLMRVATLPFPLPFGGFRNQRSLVSRDALIDAIRFALDADVTRETFIVADRAPIAFCDVLAALRRGLGRRPGLLAVPRAFIATPLRLVGRGDILERIDGELIASPDKLIEKGWLGAADSATALEEVARQVAAGRRL